MNEQLQVFIHELDSALAGASKTLGERWSGIGIASLQIVLQVTPEPGDTADTLALRIGSDATTSRRSHELSIEVPGGLGPIMVRFDGQLFARYGRLDDGQET